MASLQSIMNLDEDVDSHANKRDKDSGTPATRPPQHHPESSSSATDPSYATPRDQPDNTSPAQGKRRSSSGRVNKSSAAGSSSSSSSTSRPTTGRRRSHTGTDSMDQSLYAQHTQPGPSPSSSSGGLTPSNVPMRPFAPMPGGEMPLKLTPITGRVSRAKKGVPVHTCDDCRPAKVGPPHVPGPLAMSQLLTSTDLYQSGAFEVRTSRSLT